MLQTGTQGHTNNMAMLKVWILESQSLCCLYYRTVCVLRSLQLFNHL